MTPMQMLKKDLILLGKKLNEFKEINLNKSQPNNTVVKSGDDENRISVPVEEKNISVCSKKEVKSDFVKIFKLKGKQCQCSLAFHFTYINVSEPVIYCSMKDNGRFLRGDEMSVLELKEHLTDLNNNLNSDDALNNIEKIKSKFFNTQKKKTLKK